MSLDASTLSAGLVVAGIAAPAVYLGTVLIGGAMRPGYSHRGNAISELVERGAPNKIGLNVAFAAYNLLSAAFGWALTGLGGLAAASGWLLVATALAGVVMTVFPMDPVGRPATALGIGHLVIAGLMSIGTLVAIVTFALGAGAAGSSGLAWFSYVMFAVVGVTGAIAAVSAARRWPTIGLWERLTIGSFLVWELVLAITFIV